MNKFNHEEILDNTIRTMFYNLMEARSILKEAIETKNEDQKYMCAHVIGVLVACLKPTLQYLKSEKKESKEFVEDIEELLIEAEASGMLRFKKKKDLK